MGTFVQVRSWYVGGIVRLVVGGGVAALASGVCVAQPQQDDIVAGWSRASATETIGLYDAGGQQKADNWDAFGFVQSVTWDNAGGIAHNPMGNLIGGNFGTTANGGSIYIYQSGDGWDGSEAMGAGPTAHQTFGSLGLLTTRLGGVSVSPDNTKIAFTGNDAAQIYVLDYDAANRTVTAGRQTSGFPLPIVGGVTSGTAWLDENTVLAVSGSGDIISVDAATMMWTVVATVPGANLGGSQFTSIAYTPSISDYIYVSYSQFDSGTQVTTNALHAVDPTNWQVVRTIDLSISANTMREIALDSQGNLFFTVHGGAIHRIDDVRIPANMIDNSSVVIGGYGAGASPPFSGLDVASAGGAEPPCYANCTGSTTPPILTVDDFTCFINAFAAAQSLPHEEQIAHYANCDGSTTPPVLTVDDFTCFIDAFAAGCP